MRVQTNLLQRLVESGIHPTDTRSTKRNIIFSNYIALILSVASTLVFFIIPQNWNLGGLRESLVSIAIFFLPIGLNRLSYFNIAKIYLCWTPPILIFWRMVVGMSETEVVSVSSYDGLRIYLLATSCIPYLLMERKNMALFVVGILPSLLFLLFCDSILEFFNVGYSQKGIPDSGYALTPIRSLTAYVVVGGSCFILKYIIDQTDSYNQKLINELEKKNSIIQEQSESELHQLNQKLQANLKELTKRELILKRSQQIAKVGSWVFNLSDKTLYWSDQMYEIFGLDKSLNLENRNLTKVLFGEYSTVIDSGNKELIHTKKPYDYTLQTKTPLGYLKWVRVSGFPLTVNNEVTGIIGIVHDVTYFKESEDKIRSNEKNYRSLFEQASDAIMITDFNGNFLDVNTAMCSMLGYSKEDPRPQLDGILFRLA